DAVGADLPDQRRERGLLRRRHPRSRFIEQEQTRMRGERDRELEEPLLAVGERIRRDVLLRREADEVDHTVGLHAERALLDVYASAAQQRGDEADITAQMQAGD